MWFVQYLTLTHIAFLLEKFVRVAFLRICCELSCRSVAELPTEVAADRPRVRGRGKCTC